MHIIKRITQSIKAKRNHVSITEVRVLSACLRGIISNDKALELLKSNDFETLVNVALYADLGVWTAIQAAFCMGYKAGKAKLPDGATEELRQLSENGTLSYTDGQDE